MCIFKYQVYIVIPQGSLLTQLRAYIYITLNIMLRYVT